MLISKRFEFSAAHCVPAAQDERERRLHGHNYVLHVAVSGQPDAVGGMVVNLATLKAQVHEILDRYDHRMLNNTLPAQAGGPTVEAVAEALWADLEPALRQAPLARVALAEDGGWAAEVTPAGTRAVVTGQFAAAHRTHIPTYSDEANLDLFGVCNNPAGHGHNYRIIAEGEGPAEALAGAVRRALAEFDHRNLSRDIPDLAGRNVTTEAVARLLWARLRGQLAGDGRLRRVRLHELPDFFAEYAGEGNTAYLGRRCTFFAAHRLASPRLTQAENEALYGKCSRPDPHGHSYRVEVTAEGQIDEETGLAMNLADLDRLAGEAIGPLDGRYLDAEVAAFKDQPSTGEVILEHLWGELEARFGSRLARLRLWETRNNCFEIDRRP